MSRGRVALLLAFAVALGAGAVVLAQNTNSGEELIVARIQAAYGADFSNLDELVRTLRAAGYGWGEVIMALHLAKRSGRAVEGIMAMRADGKGWGQIAMELGVHPSELGLAVAAVMSEGRSPGAAGKPDGTPGGPPAGTSAGPPDGTPGRPDGVPGGPPSGGPGRP